jgi:hypothetical protein
MAPDIPLDGQRPAEYVFSRHVQQALERLKHSPPSNVADAAD